MQNSRRSDRAYISVGTLVLLLVGLVARATAIGRSSGEMSMLLLRLFEDLPLVTFVFASIVLRARVNWKAARSLLFCLEISLVLAVVLDAATLFTIDRHAWPSEASWILVSAFDYVADIPYLYVALAAIAPCALLIRVPTRNTSGRTLSAIAACTAAVSAVSVIEIRASSGSAIAYLQTIKSDVVNSRVAHSSSTADVIVARQALERWTAPVIPSDRRSIILLLNESFSSVDSKLISGINDFYPAFDKLSETGRLYVNGFANAYNTVDGIAAVVSGITPFSTIDGRRPQTLLGQIPSRIKNYVDAGYRTAYLSSSTLNYASTFSMLKSVGFERVQGGARVPRFKAAKRFVWNGAPDHILYQEGLQWIEELKTSGQPYLLILETISGHPPYTHPLGGGDTEPAVRKYVDEAMVQFSESLIEGGILDDAVLIIVGDHRKQQPLEEKERERFGAGARERVPMLVLGKGVVPGISNQVMQQTDLLFDIEHLASGTARTRLPIVLWERRPSNAYGVPTSVEGFGDGLLLDPKTEGRSGTPYSIVGERLIVHGMPLEGTSLVEAQIRNYRRALSGKPSTDAPPVRRARLPLQASTAPEQTFHSSRP